MKTLLSFGRNPGAAGGFLPSALLLLGSMGMLTLPAHAEGVTRYTQMEARLKHDVQICPSLRLTVVGQSVHKKNIYLVRIAGATQAPARTVRVLVLCRQHGDEPASTEAVLKLVYGVVQGDDPSLRAAGSAVTLYLMPMVNPDGADAGTRENGTPADLNRDWGRFTQPETRAVAWAVTQIHPHVIIDAHNWDANDTYDANCIEVGRDLPNGLKDAERRLQAEAVARLTADGFNVNPTSYGSDANTGLAHRYFSRRGIVSFLVETHSGDPKNTADFLHRQTMYIALIHAVVCFYARCGLTERLALERLEGQTANAKKEAELFHPVPKPSKMASLPKRRTFLLAVKATCLYGLALGLFLLGSARLPSSSQKARRKKPYYTVKCSNGIKTVSDTAKPFSMSRGRKKHRLGR